MNSAKAGSSTDGMVPTADETGLGTATGSSGDDDILLFKTAREITPLYNPKMRRATMFTKTKRNV